jgi:hypothetical protein
MVVSTGNSLCLPVRAALVSDPAAGRLQRRGDWNAVLERIAGELRQGGSFVAVVGV